MVILYVCVSTAKVEAMEAKAAAKTQALSAKAGGSGLMYSTHRARITGQFRLRGLRYFSSRCARWPGVLMDYRVRILLPSCVPHEPHAC